MIECPLSRVKEHVYLKLPFIYSTSVYDGKTGPVVPYELSGMCIYIIVVTGGG